MHITIEHGEITKYLLLTAPRVIGEMTPIANIPSGIQRPYLCFLSWTRAMSAAMMWTNIEENNAHRNTWYHISENLSYNNMSLCARKPTIWVLTRPDTNQPVVTEAEKKLEISDLRRRIVKSLQRKQRR